MKIKRALECISYVFIFAFLMLTAGYACTAGAIGEICDGGTCNVNVNFHFPNDEGGTSQFTPDQLVGLQLWMKSDRGIVGWGGSSPLINSWNDLSDNAYSYSVAGSSGIGPCADGAGTGSSFICLYLDAETASFNSHPGINFSGPHAGAATTTGAGVSSSAVTIFTVPNTTTSTCANLSSVINTDLTGTDVLELGYNTSCYADANLMGIELSGAASLLNRTIVLAVTAKSGGQYVLYVNGVPVASTVVGSMHLLLGSGTLGYYNVSGGASFLGELAEVVEYDHVLSPSDFDQVNSYLLTRYAITP